MRSHSFILLVVAIFHGVNSAVLRSTTSNMMAPPIASSQGLLRSLKTEDVDNDERVDTHGLSSKVAGLMSKVIKPSSSQSQVRKWMQHQFHPRELFNALSLGNAAAKLDDNKNLLQWFQYAVAFRAKNGNQAFSDLDMYYLLLKTNSADELTTLFQSLEKTPGLKQLFASMQKSLSGSWLKKLREEENPRVVFKMLHLESAGAKLDETPIFHQWLQYVDMFRANKGHFDDNNMLQLFQRTMPEEDVVRLVHKLRQVPGMQNHADMMQRILLLEKSKTSHKVMRDVWLKTRETPEEVYKILHLGEAPMDAFTNNAKLFQWLRYIQRYRAKNDNLFSNAQLYRFLEKEIEINSGELGALFQVIKEVPDLNKIGVSMQTTLFNKLIHQKLTPEKYHTLLVVPYPFELAKRDPRFRTLKAYTLQFAKERGGEEVLKQVKTLFANGDPDGALAAAVGKAKTR